jgi:hypothetical protein
METATVKTFPELGKVNNGYTIVGAVPSCMAQDAYVVLARNDDRQYVTWRTYAYDNFRSFYSGNYFDGPDAFAAAYQNMTTR